MSKDFNKLKGFLAAFFVSIYFAVMILAICSCKKEDIIVPRKKISYSMDIVPILKTSGCLSCHTGPNPSGNVKFDSLALTKYEVLQDRFFPSVKVQPGYVYAAMPPYFSSYVMLSDEEIQKIRDWIKDGFNP